jgi:outer membrane protein
MKLKIFTLLFLFAINYNVFSIELGKKYDELFLKSQEKSLELKSNLSHQKTISNHQFSEIANFLPKANLNLKNQKNFYESTNPILLNLGLTTPKYLWNIEYQWPIFNYVNLINYQKAHSHKSLSEINFQISNEEYAIDSKTLFLNLLLSRYKKATILNSIKKSETALKEAEINFQIGKQTKIDVLRAKANSVSLEAKNISANDEEQNSRTKYLQKTGLIEDDLFFLNDLNEEDLLSSINELAQFSKIDHPININESLLFKRLQFSKNNQSFDAKLINSQSMPQLSLVGTFENTGTQFKNAIETPSRSHSLALVLTIPLFNGGSTISTSFEKYHALKEVEYLNEIKFRELKDSFENMKIKINALISLVESLKLNVNQYEELYRLTLKSYQLGKSTLFELQDVQDNLLNSKIELASKKIQLFTTAQTYNWQTLQK